MRAGSLLVRALEELAVDGLTPAAREIALARMLECVQSWAPKYTRRRFSGMLRQWAPRDAADLIDDACQHLAIAIAERSAASLVELTGSENARALAWCRRVISNFVLSEARLLARRSSLPPPRSENGADFDGALETRDAFGRLVSALRAELVDTVRRRGADHRRALLDEFIRSFVRAPHGGDRRLSNRTEQRRSRGRKLAREAWERVKSRGDASTELEDVAVALGL